MTARDLQGRISIAWVTSQLAELVSKSPAIILLFEERHPPLLGMGQQMRPLRCTSTRPALHQLRVCSGPLNSVQDKPSLQPCSPVHLWKVQKLPRLAQRATCTGECCPSAHTLCLHSPRLILCLSQDISSISWRNFRGARHNKNMARILWCNEKAIAGQGLTWHRMVPSRHLSHHKPCFISGETGTTGA